MTPSKPTNDVKATFVGSISTRGNEIFNIFISSHIIALVTMQSAMLSSAVHHAIPQESHVSCAYPAVWETNKNIKLRM